MLRSLHIRDFAIIDELEVEFGPGMNVLTGETGAGKTIVVEALNLAMGSRADASLVRSGSERASVTAIFEAKDQSPEVAELLSNSGVECGGELVINRVVADGGKGRASINGIPVSVNALRAVAERLVDISGQHEHQLLLSAEEQVKILDEFGGLCAKAAEYASLHRNFITLRDEVASLESSREAAKQKLDYLKFQLDELAGANLKEGEEQALEAERGRLKHGVVLEEKARAAWALTYGDAQSSLASLDAAIKLVRECEQYDATVAEFSEGLSRARSDIEDAARNLSKYTDKLEADPDRLAELDERLHLLRRIVKKHGGSVEAALSGMAKLKEEIAGIENYDDILEEKRAKLNGSGLRRKEAAGALSRARKKAAAVLSSGIEGELAELAMSKTSFSVNFAPRTEAEWDESGADAIEFMFSPNVGEPEMGLSRIASGGELSRVMLAIKGVLAGKADVGGTSIFDEVDSGIGGAVASVVGKKLEKLARKRQVICVTHLPQVAVFGDTHIAIRKGVVRGRTVASLAALDAKERESEIARMLGGDKITATTKAHAAEMIAAASRG